RPRLDRANVHEARDPLPPSGLGITGNLMLGRPRLTQDLEEETLLFERSGVGLQGSVDAREREPHSRVLTRPEPGPSIEVRVELERAVGFLGVEAASGSNGMSQGNAEAAALRQDARDLGDRTVQVEHILETHERGCEICGAGSERKRTCIT